ncbi:riboflavin biosynthesis protein RibF [Fischerella major NIES-592]|uniref:Riboflavin biosynthesis protein n=1 Tax=Fischerella major NIES-592 TaxID=210994 RepID=A0A1U7GUV4_9CYAN|nr:MULTISPECIES: bifunctional riboflavin kinase/FAD synthetase [Fischerella]OKH11822.1 riboflavin biosynthesis protein RibF [Fischerella major NIES-592]BAU08768.1 riboflavin biosynthesis protein RibF [Fischerella sp. NIES-3754]BCX06234.1 MAG: riboflavin biosynthesis protein [Fischerella sp.]
MPNLSQNGCSVWVTSSPELALTPTAVALGKFDGVHRGHQRVIQPILPPFRKDGEIERWKEPEMGRTGDGEKVTPPPHNGSIYSTVVTFNPHPQEFFTGKPRSLLTPLDEKVHQLRSLGVQQLVLLPFDKELCALTPEEFVEKILVQQLQAVKISVGQDFRFGSKRSGTADDLQIIAAKYNIPVTITSLETCAESQENKTQVYQQTRISSSLIREILASGNIERANQLLGRPYTLIGTVIQGQQVGRTIGFPTANLELPKDKFLPHHGVYAVRVFTVNEILDVTGNGYFGVMNIGNRPTVNGIHLSVEVHLFDWSGDLYGKKLAVHLEKFLRPEQKFPHLEALKTQIQLDCSAARAFFKC